MIGLRRNVVCINRSFSSPNYNSRDNTTIDLVILHYTDMTMCQAAIDRLCDIESRVSSHYVIARDGEIFALVAEEKRAWHAGVSCWRGATNINDRSIGIELDYPGIPGGLPDYAEAQITALIALLRDIITRYRLDATCVVGHEDIAPKRKVDPGPRFPWAKLRAALIRQ